jgi:hypothetical protein
VPLDEQAAGRDDVLRLGVEQADLPDVWRQAGDAEARIACGVRATETAAAWRGYAAVGGLGGSITATSSSNGVENSSSLRGSGFAARNAPKIAAARSRLN